MDQVLIPRKYEELQTLLGVDWPSKSKIEISPVQRKFAQKLIRRINSDLLVKATSTERFITQSLKILPRDKKYKSQTVAAAAQCLKVVLQPLLGNELYKAFNDVLRQVTDEIALREVIKEHLDSTFERRMRMDLTLLEGLNDCFGYVGHSAFTDEQLHDEVSGWI